MDEGGGGGRGGGSSLRDAIRAENGDDALADATPDDGRVQVAQAGGENDRYSASLREHEEKLGGHTLRVHVGKSNEELLEFVRKDRFELFSVRAARIQQGSFASEGDAQYFVNETLKARGALVDAVASGAIMWTTLNYRFGQRTGTEAFRPGIDADPVIRPTHSVRVIIEHDKRSATGYRVLTAFPRNRLPEETWSDE